MCGISGSFLLDEQVREATADLIEQGHKLENSEAELSEVKEKVDKAQQSLDDKTARIEKILDYLPKITRDEKLENEYLELSSRLKELLKSPMSIIRNKDEIINVTDELRAVVKKAVDEAYKAAYAVYDHREYSANKQKELDDTLERLKQVRSEKFELSSELQSVRTEFRQLSEVYAMLEKLAPSTVERAKQLVQEQKEQRPSQPDPQGA